MCRVTIPSQDIDDVVRRDELIGETDWTALPAGAVRSTFPAPSGPLARLTLGEPGSPRVVLIPGATGSKEDFVLMLPLLAAAGYAVEAYDLAGNYESAAAGPADGGRYDYELFVDDLIAVLEAGGPAHLLGYSFAGIVAQLVTARRPELVRSLTLLTTPPDAGNAYRHVKWIGWLSHVLSARVGARLMIWGIRSNLNRVDAARLAFVRDRFALTRRACIEDIVALMKRAPDVAEQLRATGVPTLLATSEHDLWPLHRYARHAERIGARIAVYRTGHSPCETTPHQLVRDMLRLFGEAESG